MIEISALANSLLKNRAILSVIAISGICIFFSSGCSAGVVKQLDCRRAISTIEIDGKLDEAAWKKAEVIKFVIPVTCKQPLSKTETRILWDNSCLYVSYRAYDKDIWSVYKERDSQTCMEDCLECFIQPDPARQTYYNFEINAIGTVYDSYNIGRNSGGYDHHRWAAWNCEGVRTGITIAGTLNNWTDVDNYWQMELAIPFSELPSLNGTAPKVGDVWNMLLARYDFSVYLTDGAELSNCSHLTKMDFHDSKEWAMLKFAE